MDVVVRKAMARQPEDRYLGALELSSELEAIAQGRMTRAGAETAGRKGTLADWIRFNNKRSDWSHHREYRSEMEFLGLPLVHIVHGGRLPGEAVRIAKGWIAIGEVAAGGFAMGGMAVGVAALGGAAFGYLTYGNGRGTIETETSAEFLRSIWTGIETVFAGIPNGLGRG